MKKLLLILLCLPMIGFGQDVYIPDANFKVYLVGDTAINTNGDAEIQVTEAAVYSSYISCVALNITDLTGIEAFTALTQLSCYTNQITSLDLSQNIALIDLQCQNNQLTALDVSANTALTYLGCNGNQLTSLDLSDNTSLVYLSCGNSQLQCLNIANGNNLNLDDCSIWNSPLLTCIEADDSTYMNNNWQSHFGPINSQYYFSNHCNNDCSLTYIQEHTTNKELLKVTDLLGRETKQTNQPLFYIYDDGTVEKRIVIE